MQTKYFITSIFTILGIGSRCEVVKERLSLKTNSDVLTPDLDLHWANAVELRHALDFSEANFGAV